MSPKLRLRAVSGHNWPRGSVWIALPSLALMLLLYFQFTSVSGLEIHPESWQVRQFSFRREPLTNLQFTGIKHSAPKSLAAWTPGSKSAGLDAAIAKHLRAASQSNRDWDLVQIDFPASRGDAWPLVELLTATDSNFNPFWPAWSTQNASKAALLWPAAQDLASHGLYAQLPRLLELSLGELSQAEFQRRIAIHMQQSILPLARSELAQGRHLAASRLAQVGLFYGSSPELAEILRQAAADPSPPGSTQP